MGTGLHGRAGATPGPTVLYQSLEPGRRAHSDVGDPLLQELHLILHLSTIHKQEVTSCTLIPANQLTSCGLCMHDGDGSSPQYLDVFRKQFDHFGVALEGGQLPVTGEKPGGHVRTR